MPNIEIFIGMFGLGIATILIMFYMVKDGVEKYLDDKKRQSYVDKHVLYMTILDFYMEKAFEIIYKDRILVYSIEGTKPDDDDVRQNSIDFAKLALKLIGSNLTKEFIYLYGDEDTFIFTLVEYFNSKAEHDEIKEASINQIMEGSNNEII